MHPPVATGFKRQQTMMNSINKADKLAKNGDFSTRQTFTNKSKHRDIMSPEANDKKNLNRSRTTSNKSKRGGHTQKNKQIKVSQTLRPNNKNNDTSRIR